MHKSLLLMIALSTHLYIIKSNLHQAKTKDQCPSRPIEREERHLRTLIYCNSDIIQSGDPCYCGRVLPQCCASKELCSGSISRTCAKPINNYRCEVGIGQGVAYWRELDLLQNRFMCSNNERDDEIKFCFCRGQCCSSNQFCTGFISSCEERYQIPNEKCLKGLGKIMRNKKPKKYYENYQEKGSGSGFRIEIS